MWVPTRATVCAGQVVSSRVGSQFSGLFMVLRRLVCHKPGAPTHRAAKLQRDLADFCLTDFSKQEKC